MASVVWGVAQLRLVLTAWEEKALMTKRQRLNDWQTASPASPDLLDDLSPLHDLLQDLRSVEVGDRYLRDADLAGRGAHGFELMKAESRASTCPRKAAASNLARRRFHRRRLGER
jgi:hypothetical protein